MCGISGIISKENQPVADTLIRTMNDRIAHRGPDGEGFYAGTNFAFGHRRLAILDLSPAGHQPMFFGEELVLVFNGEIYNYIEIRTELQALNYTFTSDSDTEVILAAYHCWGQECVKHFNGMWAFALYDKTQGIIFCSRDRFGVKPFYYCNTSRYFAFGSEIRQLLPLNGSVRANENRVLDYLVAGLEEHTKETFFEGILKLPPSHNLVYQLADHSFSIKRYYEISTRPAIAAMSESEAIKVYMNEFERSIQLRLRSDVKVGTCLSGGLDSSAVAAVASKQYGDLAGRRFSAIHARSTEKESDESRFAQTVADFAALDLQLVEPGSDDFLRVLDDVINTQEEPFGSPSVFMQYFVLQKARSLNCIVMLDGQGGDETLLGYEKYYPAYLMDLRGLKKWRGFLDASKNSKLSRKEVLFYFVYFTRYKIRLKRLKRRSSFVREEFLKNYRSEELKKMANAYLRISDLQRLEIESTQLPALLKYEDKNSMRHSVETRLPFLDFNVVETALSIKSEYKIHNGWTKYVLRKGLENRLPDSVVWRKNKLGFNAPEKTWLNGIETKIESELQASGLIRKYVDLERLNLKQTDIRTKWRLYNLACWQKIHHVETN